MSKGIVYMDAEMDEIEESEGMNDGSGFGDEELFDVPISVT